jgi:hypothetical protein
MKKLDLGQLFQTSCPKEQNDFSKRIRGQNGNLDHVPKGQLPWGESDKMKAPTMFPSPRSNFPKEKKGFSLGGKDKMVAPNIFIEELFL